MKVHVSSIRLASPFRMHEYGFDGYYDVFRVDAAIGQKKVELSGDFLYSLSQVHLVPGDYNARLVKAARDPREAPFYEEYEIILPDRTVWRGIVTGISE